ncbi:hypothetical protein [Leptolyngbya sp. FACHB-261]|uniref:hypothetical protein n=1 Tax=Leptolyngbya sp. FACHB-261 TaxID=2692806 RepID=UPI0016822AA8|nr:hypothetical protein [Leptolyngbya sp. FACHB-261]MBD2104358.1 hypothetical protein [Leptolyngbya sp. FACHB-261]
MVACTIVQPAGRTAGRKAKMLEQLSSQSIPTERGSNAAVQQNADHEDALAPLACPLACEAFMVLDFEGLPDFKPVDIHFQSQGVTFAGPIALRPSNPAFPPHSGNTVLLGAQENRRPIEAIFAKPVEFVGAWVTASKPMIMSAYDAAGQLLDQATLSAANLGKTDSGLSPNQFLSVRAVGIHRVTFTCYDGNLVLDDLTFYPAVSAISLETTV